MRRFENIACYILVIGALISISMMLLTSCSPKTVSTATHTIERKDSIASNTESFKDSSYRIESFEEKILPAATVGITLNKNQMDSLIDALGNLPSSVPRVVYYQDPKLRAMLSIMIDSIGSLSFYATALEQTLLQKNTEQGRYTEKEKGEKLFVTVENTQKTEVVKEKRPSLWQSIKGFGGFLVVFIVIVLVVGLWSKIKPWFK